MKLTKLKAKLIETGEILDVFKIDFYNEIIYLGYFENLYYGQKGFAFNEVKILK